jgi:aryl-alcohol dehydrogenase-like predicted oxidoreductase
VDDAESIRAVQLALDSGVSFFDTAANYGAGHSERILGQALAGRREQAVIATKFGFYVNEADKRVTRYNRKEDVIANVRADCEASLQRLGTDYIDLYQLHVGDYPVVHVLELRETLEDLVREGKIRCYGWSTDDAVAAHIFGQGKHCAAIQHDLNVVLDAPGVLATCEELDLASVNRSPLARGALTGKYSKESAFAENDVRRDQWSYEHFYAPTLDKLDALRDILTSGGRTLAQGALAWIWGRSRQTVPIPGCRTEAQVRENAGAMAFGPLTEGQMGEIENLLGRNQ